MPGFLSAIFTPADDESTTHTSSDQQSFGSHLDLDPSIHVHFAENGSTQHADGSTTEWSSSQNIDAHLDIHAVTDFVIGDTHDGGVG